MPDYQPSLLRPLVILFIPALVFGMKKCFKPRFYLPSWYAFFGAIFGVLIGELATPNGPLLLTLQAIPICGVHVMSQWLFAHFYTRLKFPFALLGIVLFAEILEFVFFRPKEICPAEGFCPHVVDKPLQSACFFAVIWLGLALIPYILFRAGRLIGRFVMAD